MEETAKLIYKPPTTEEVEAKKATLGVKFSNDLFLTESWLIKMNVQYEQSDLEQTPFGMAHRIRKDKKDMLEQFPDG